MRAFQISEIKRSPIILTCISQPGKRIIIIIIVIVVFVVVVEVVIFCHGPKLKGSRTFILSTGHRVVIIIISPIKALTIVVVVVVLCFCSYVFVLEVPFFFVLSILTSFEEEQQVVHRLALFIAA